MANFRYTKKIILVDTSPTGHQDDVAPFIVDCFYDQVEQGLADSSHYFFPYCIEYHVEHGWTAELLVADQAQADSYIAVEVAVAEQIGYSFSFTIVDVDYTTDTIPDNFLLFDR